METPRSRHETPHRRDGWEILQRVLLLLMAICLVGALAFLSFLFQMWYASHGTGPHPTPLPSTLASPSPCPTSILSPTPTPTLPPESSPTPTPSLPPVPGVLSYALYSGNPDLPEIALTFDDGPDPASTPQILASLQRYGINATFFMVGAQVASYSELAAQEYQQGNIVGNHTWTHPELIKLSPDIISNELESTSQELQADTGKWPSVFRPPYGEFNSSVQTIATHLGLSTVLWSVDPKDWSRPGSNVITERVLSATHNGSIILLHDGGGDRSQTVEALPAIITTLAQRGFQFVTVPQLIQHLPPEGTGPTKIFPDQFVLDGAPPLCLATPHAFHDGSLPEDSFIESGGSKFSAWQRQTFGMSSVIANEPMIRLRAAFSLSS